MKSKLDACARSVKARVAVWPSARASQMVAKCRKKHGHVRHSSAGTSLKRWEREKWKDTKTHKPCGESGKHSKEYCRPSKKVSSKTPTMYHGKKLKAMQSKKAKGQRANGR
jgi:hypothetical protein